MVSEWLRVRPKHKGLISCYRQVAVSRLVTYLEEMDQMDYTLRQEVLSHIHRIMEFDDDITSLLIVMYSDNFTQKTVDCKMRRECTTLHLLALRRH